MAQSALLKMIRQEQYEIWVQNGANRWDMLGCFQDAGLASSLAKNHPVRARLICITFEYGKIISQEVVTEFAPGAAEMAQAS